MHQKREVELGRMHLMVTYFDGGFNDLTGRTTKELFTVILNSVINTMCVFMCVRALGQRETTENLVGFGTSPSPPVVQHLVAIPNCIADTCKWFYLRMSNRLSDIRAGRLQSIRPSVCPSL